VSDLDETKSWMRWWGWTNDGGPGAVKIDADKRIIARHHDETWHADVEKAYQLARRTRPHGANDG
jgi:hypothetical protein